MSDNPCKKCPGEISIDWFVGFFEGEGCFEGHRFSAVLTVSQKEKSLLERIRKWLWEEHGIYSGIYTRSNKWGATSRLAVWRKSSLREIVEWMEPRLISERRRAQLKKWKKEYLNA